MAKQGAKEEKMAKEVLEKEFQTSLSERVLNIGKHKKSFDLVSDDGQIVVEVKSYKLGNETTGKAGYTTTRKQRLITACWYLERVKAMRKILILTDKELYKQFINDVDGLLSSEIEVRCL